MRRRSFLIDFRFKKLLPSVGSISKLKSKPIRTIMRTIESMTAVQLC